MAGKMNVRGTLHLFIVDISAWADLDVEVGEDQNHNKLSNISGDICGKVDFLFFSVSGCVHFTLSATTVPIPDPPDLVKTLKLISRSPALVIGTGVDKPIDASLADAIEPIRSRRSISSARSRQAQRLQPGGTPRREPRRSRRSSRC
jgi:hypothetical protein